GRGPGHGTAEAGTTSRADGVLVVEPVRDQRVQAVVPAGTAEARDGRPDVRGGGVDRDGALVDEIPEEAKGARVVGPGVLGAATADVAVELAEVLTPLPVLVGDLPL